MIVNCTTQRKELVNNDFSNFNPNDLEIITGIYL
jgi:hypothetical protein